MERLPVAPPPLQPIDIRLAQSVIPHSNLHHALVMCCSLAVCVRPAATDDVRLYPGLNATVTILVGPAELSDAFGAQTHQARPPSPLTGRLRAGTARSGLGYTVHRCALAAMETTPDTGRAELKIGQLSLRDGV
jgi:hypothetical protein